VITLSQPTGPSVGNFQGIACKYNGKWEGIVRLSGALLQLYELAARLEDELGARRAADRRVDEEVRGHRT
jgi:hypothetical protein